jgi:hypothetical protein
MQNITSVAGLKNAIQLLEVEQGLQGQQLKEQFYITYESLRPINLLRNILKEIFSSPDLVENLSGTALGAASGFLIKKLFIGKSGNPFRKLLGSIVQFGMSNIVAQNADFIKSAGQYVFQHLFRKKE